MDTGTAGQSVRQSTLAKFFCSHTTAGGRTPNRAIFVDPHARCDISSDSRSDSDSCRAARAEFMSSHMATHELRHFRVCGRIWLLHGTCELSSVHILHKEKSEQATTYPSNNFWILLLKRSPQVSTTPVEDLKNRSSAFLACTIEAFGTPQGDAKRATKKSAKNRY